MLKELFDDGERASSSRTPTRNASSNSPAAPRSPLRAGDSLMLESRSGYAYEKIHKAEVEELVLEEVPDISYNEIGGLGSQIEMIRDAVELLPTCTPTCSANTSSGRPRASSSTDRPDAARRSSPRPSPTRWPRRSPSRPAPRARASSSTSRAPSCSTSTSARPSGTSASSSSAPARRRPPEPRHRLLRRDGLHLPHPRIRSLLRRREHHRPAAAQARSTASRAWRTSSSSAPPTART